jgi:rhodanese-related sulfurtransferase
MIPQIRPSQLSDWLAAVHAAGQPLPMLLDVREPAEWATASVPADAAFELVKVAMGTVPQHAPNWDTTRPVAVLCHHGARSQRVAQFLLGQGFTRVVNVAGGIDAWSAERDPGVPRY